MTGLAKAKRGEIYIHRHFMDERRTPLLCKVTRIAQGVAYYRPYYGVHEDGSEWLGSPYYVSLDKFWDSFNTPVNSGLCKL
jgi:hypothetical protein